MARRERLERKVERRQAWAESADARAEARFATAHDIVSHIPLGQPILVGHHSERRHRRDLDRMASNMDKGLEASKLAEHHRARAQGLATQLERTIFADDADAITQLEAKIAGLERLVTQWKAINAAYKKAKGGEGWGDALGLSRETQQRMASEVGRYSWIKAPIEAYQFSNARNRIRQARERIAQIRARNERATQAEQAGGVAIETHGDYVRVTFAEKPAREILDALRAAGFRWGGGSWVGRADQMPETIHG